MFVLINLDADNNFKHEIEFIILCNESLPDNEKKRQFFSKKISMKAIFMNRKTVKPLNQSNVF